jgi:hypothetical protein
MGSSTRPVAAEPWIDLGALRTRQGFSGSRSILGTLIDRCRGLAFSLQHLSTPDVVICLWARTHARFKVGRRGGEVRLSKSNTFIALAPYFLPLYALLWSLFLILIRWWFGASDWFGPLLYAGLGIAYSFHVTLTVVILRIRQPDLVGEGFFFSGTLIWFGNAIVLLVALPLLTGSSGVAEAIRLAAWRSLDVVRFFCRWIQ